MPTIYDVTSLGARGQPLCDVCTRAAFLLKNMGRERKNQIKILVYKTTVLKDPLNSVVVFLIKIIICHQISFYFFPGRSFYTTRFGKRSEPMEERSSSSSDSQPDASSQEIPNVEIPSRSTFYTTRFGRRSDPSWNVRVLKQRQMSIQDGSLENQSELDNYQKNGQPLLSMIFFFIKWWT